MTSWLQRNTFAILYISYIISFVFMIITLLFYGLYSLGALQPDEDAIHSNYNRDYLTEIMGFFGASNALVLFRVFGLKVITSIAHGVIMIIVLLLLVMHDILYVAEDDRDFIQLFVFPTYLLLICYVLQILFAFHLVVFRPGRSPQERETRSGIHAFMGLITYIIQFWNLVLFISMMCTNPKHKRPIENIMFSELLIEPAIMSAFLVLHTLLILFILLTPYFESELRSEARKNRKPKRGKARKSRPTSAGRTSKDATKKEPPQTERKSNSPKTPRNSNSPRSSKTK